MQVFVYFYTKKSLPKGDFLWGPRGFLILGGSVDQNVALYKCEARSRAQF